MYDRTAAPGYAGHQSGKWGALIGFSGGRGDANDKPAASGGTRALAILDDVEVTYTLHAYAHDPHSKSYGTEATDIAK
ncbi:MAG: hypothetical protein Q4G30_06065 [Actinomycetaceae bacterium]|nr:hypothetical protein [Actinomycetaceae bacterium]